MKCLQDNVTTTLIHYKLSSLLVTSILGVFGMSVYFVIMVLNCPCLEHTICNVVLNCLCLEHTICNVVTEGFFFLLPTNSV